MLRTSIMLRIALVCLLPLWAAWAEESSVNYPQSNQDSVTVSGAVPRLVSFSGAVKDAAGKPLTGPVDLHFAIYENFDGLEPLWFETQTVDVDAQGHYTVLLGAMRPEGLPPDLFTPGTARWLEVMVVGGTTQPRVLLVSVPYAFKAGDAETLGGKPATAFVAADQLKEQVRSELKAAASTEVGLRSVEAMVTNPASTPSALINETSPATFTCATSGTCVAVTQNGTGYPLTGTSTATSGVTFGMRGQSNSTGGYGMYGYVPSTTGVTFGVRGDTESTSGRGVYGNAKAATGDTYGVLGYAASTGGTGVFGNATATTGVTYALRGYAASTSGRGAFGYASAATGGTFGVVGSAASVSGTGVYGNAGAATGTGIGVRGVAASATGTAGVFDAPGGGKILSGRSGAGYDEKFSVDASGNVTAAGTFSGAFGGSWSGPFSTYVLTGSAITGNSGYGYGIYGISSSGTGIYGSSSSGVAIYGISTSANGVTGKTSATSYPAVVGLAPSGGKGVTGLAGPTSFSYSNEAGVYGESINGSGVIGVTTGSGTSAVWGYTGNANALSGRNNSSSYATLILNNYSSNSGGLLFRAVSPNYLNYGCSIWVNGDLLCNGFKSAVVSIAGGRQVALYAVEATENWFEDFGSGKLESGAATIHLDPTFLQTVNTQAHYHVFLTPMGECSGLYVARELPTSFEVRELGGGKSSVGFDYRIVARRKGSETVRLQDVTERLRRVEAKSPAANLESPSQR